MAHQVVAVEQLVGEHIVQQLLRLQALVAAQAQGTVDPLRGQHGPGFGQVAVTVVGHHAGVAGGRGFIAEDGEGEAGLEGIQLVGDGFQRILDDFARHLIGGEELPQHLQLLRRGAAGIHHEQRQIGLVTAGVGRLRRSRRQAQNQRRAQQQSMVLVDHLPLRYLDCLSQIAAMGRWALNLAA